MMWILTLVKSTIAKANLQIRLMVDCSQDNLLSKYKLQSQAVAGRISSGATDVMGTMIKSNIYEGPLSCESVE